MADFDKLIVSFLVDEVVGGFFISVPPGHVACVYDRGRGVLPKTWGPGLHLKIPFWQIAKLFNARVLEYTIREGFNFEDNPEALGDKPIRAVTADGKSVLIEGSILFKIDKNRANEIWENIGDDFVSKIVRPISRSRVRAVISEVGYEDLINHRTKIEERLKQVLWEEFDKRGLICEGVLLSDVQLESLGGNQGEISEKVELQKEEDKNETKTETEVKREKVSE